MTHAAAPGAPSAIDEPDAPRLAVMLTANEIALLRAVIVDAAREPGRAVERSGRAVGALYVRTLVAIDSRLAAALA